jgi:hypothetical protein
MTHISSVRILLLHPFKFVSNMDAYKNAHVNTIDTVLLFMAQKKEDILPFAPAIGAAITALIDKRAAITVSLSNAHVTTTAVTKRKKVTHDTVVTRGRGLASAAISYASSQNNPLLVKEYQAFKTKLSEAKDADLPIVASNLLNKLQEMAKALTEYGVSADSLVNFNAAIEQFKAESPAVKNTRNASSTENVEAEKLIGEARDIIVLQIGGILEHIQDKIPAIYTAFLKAAKLQKAAVARTELTLIVLHGVTNAPLEGVVSRLVNETKQQETTQETVKRIVRQSAKQKAKIAAELQQMRTSATGEVVLKRNVTKGQVWKISKEGYETLIVTLPRFQVGKKHTIEVRLMPSAV